MSEERTITIGGKERSLAYIIAGTKAMPGSRTVIERAARNLLGERLHVAQVLDSADMDADAILVWAGLRGANPKLTADQVRLWLEELQAEDVEDDGDRYAKLMLEVRRAIGESGVTGSRFTYNDRGVIRTLGKGGDEAAAAGGGLSGASSSSATSVLASPSESASTPSPE